MSSEISIQDTTLAAADGFSLAATVFAPSEAPRQTVLINSATAVPRKIYRGFARYLAERGAAVVTYDYRGVADSRPPSPSGFAPRMRDWAALDVASAVAHMRQVWPALPLRYVGHSFGGQALGLVPNSAQVSRALFVAAQAGYWGLFTFPENYRVYLMLKFLGRPVARLTGRMPGWLGIGEGLPSGVFLEWTGWVMRSRYFFDDPTLETLKNFPNYAGPLRAIGIADDPWATPPAIDLLLSGFTNAQREHVQVNPKAVGADQIGHFGFFRPARQEPLWREAADWLLA